MAVRVLRGNRVESVHRVSAAVADARGDLFASLGDPAFETCLRSAAKPFQALPLVASGAMEAFGLTDVELAIACASHGGEPKHIEAARSLLAKAGLDESALACGAHAPYHEPSAQALKGAPGAIHNNCSGKHAGMLAACVARGEATEGYLEPSHPLQRDVARRLARLAGVEEVGVAVDGCGAPAYFLPLAATARAFAHLARPDRAPAEDRASLARIADGMAGNAWYVAGTGRIDTDLMGQADGRLVAKVGGEAFHAIADRETGRALVLKVEDGSARARDPATVEALRQLGWLEPRALEVLGDWWRPPLRNWSGRVVGSIEPAFELSSKS